jgi:DNA-binding transcriptional LysR family regulator
MELRQLRHFVAVAEELQFARAAKRLGMEQSPLSNSIGRLETELKVKLFQRTTRRTWLTRAGSRFYVDAKRILNDVEAAAAGLLASDEDAPTEIRLALAEDLAGEPFTRFLFQLEHHQPNVGVEVREVSHAEAFRLVREGGADVALTLDGRSTGDLAALRAWAERLVLVLPIAHPLAIRDHVDLQEIASEPIALPRASVCPGYLAQIEDLFVSGGLKLTNRVNVKHWNTAVSFAAAGRALALCPASMVVEAPRITIVPLKEEAELVTWILYPEAASSAASLVLAVAASVRGDVPSSVTGDAAV